MTITMTASERSPHGGKGGVDDIQADRLEDRLEIPST